MTGMIETYQELAGLSVTARPAPGRPVRITKFLTYGCFSTRSV